MEKQHELLQNILNSIDAAIWSYNDGLQKISYVSEGLEKITGYPSEKFIDQKSWESIIHPDDVSIFRKLSANLRQGSSDISEYRIIHASGDIRWIENRIIPTMDESGNMIRLDGVLINITSRKRMEAALHRSEQQYNKNKKELIETEAMYRLIADNMTDLVGVININGTIRYASSSYKRLLGCNDEQVLDTSALDYIHPEDVAYVQNEFVNMIQTGTNKQVRFRLVHAEGYPVYVDCVGTPVLGDNGKVESIVAVSRNITERVQIERELKESEERYRRLIELSPQPMVSYHNGKFTYINQVGIDLLGADRADEIIGKSILDIVHPDYWEIAKKRVQLLKEKKVNKPLEYKIIRLDGPNIEVEITGIYDNKTQSALSVFNDITERKKMEKALKESEERYRRLVELSPVGISIYKDDQFMYVNPTGMKVVGAKRPEDIVGTAPLDWVHPDDKELVKELMENTLHNGYSSPMEYKIFRLDGDVIHVSATTIYDSKSSSVQLVFEDITSRKRVEQALLESEELNRRLVEFSPEAIVYHCDYQFIYVNPAGLALFGASSLDDLIGRPITDVFHPDFLETSASRIKGVYANQRNAPLTEVKLVRLDGTIIDAEVIITPIPYMGKNAGLSLVRDITKRKQAEDERNHVYQIISEREERYFRLQTSLDRFSHDLFGVMKVSELEKKFVKEVQDVIQSTNVSLIEVDKNNKVVVKRGNQNVQKKVLRDILLSDFRMKGFPISEMIEMSNGYFLKIGEINGRSCLLYIGEKPQSLKLTSKRVWLKTISRYVSVLYDNFRLIEDLTNELEEITSNQVTPPWLLRLLFNLSENERKHLSQDLHDSALQEQIIWYRRLDQLSGNPAIPPYLRKQLEQITEGLLDVIYQIRITCNELRPPMLKEEGLVSSLEALFECTQMRSNYSIQFEASHFQHSLHDELLIGLYRIVQELLANAMKHSNATQVCITLSSQCDCVQLMYEDNGIGMDVNGVENGSFNSMGIYGMKERVRSLVGDIEFQSSRNNGLTVFISIPALLNSTEYY
ncbi:PAS domain S-box protein [Peribacillus asahii]|uniref:sensor histidine kinase n=1 Tax=Peribacillus asahii TaxID=228899 RepID=UPI0037F1BEE0